MKRVLSVIALLLALPLLAQQDEQPFFSVGSMQSWSPKDKPSVQVSSWNIEALQFRLYRVNDPVDFFAGLKDLHQFGGREPKPPTRRRCWSAFTPGKTSGARTTGLLCASSFAGRACADQPRAGRPARIASLAPHHATSRRCRCSIPQQVVSVWKQYMPKRGGWSYEPVHFDNPGKGIYLLEAADKELRAYTVVMVSDPQL